MSATQTNAAAVCLDMGMAQLDETIQQSWAGMSAQERSNCSGAYSAWNTLKLAYDATAVVSVVRGGIASIKYMTGLLRLNRSFSRFVTVGKAIYNAVKSRTLSAPMGRMGARMERYVEWGRGASENLVRGVTKAEFFGSVADFSNGRNAILAERSWSLWKERAWGELEKLFNENGINKYNELIFPPNNGAVNVVKRTLDPARFNGDLIIDRYGPTTGRFTSPAGTPFEKRALPKSYESENPKKYKVIRPIPNVEEAQIIPWFGQPGYGLQYKLEKSVQFYIDEGYLQLIP